MKVGSAGIKLQWKMKEKHKRGNQLKTGDFLFYLGVCVFRISASCHIHWNWNPSWPQEIHSDFFFSVQVVWKLFKPKISSKHVLLFPFILHCPSVHFEKVCGWFGLCRKRNIKIQVKTPKKPKNPSGVSINNGLATPWQPLWLSVWHTAPSKASPEFIWSHIHQYSSM